MDPDLQLIEKNKLLISSLYEEILHRGNLAFILTAFSPDFIDHATPHQPVGYAGVRDYFIQVQVGFPDMRVIVEDVIAEGEKVVIRTTWHGTHLGMYEGIAPTDRKVKRTLIQIFRIVQGLIVEEWNEGQGPGDVIREVGQENSD
jgi:predicted ester cyclase